MTREWQRRSAERMADPEWNATVSRVRAEFLEMPEMRVTRSQAGVLFGLSQSASEWVLRQLALEGFLDCTDAGEYLRRDGRT
jgi:hypothetical protein